MEMVAFILIMIDPYLQHGVVRVAFGHEFVMRKCNSDHGTLNLTVVFVMVGFEAHDVST